MTAACRKKEAARVRRVREAAAGMPEGSPQRALIVCRASEDAAFEAAFRAWKRSREIPGRIGQRRRRIE